MAKVTKRSILSKTLQVGSLTIVSRVLGLVRDFIQAPYLGAPSATSDAFLAAFRIPNFFRKIFEEGALSSALVPYITKMMRDDRKKDVNGLITMTLMFGVGLMLVVTALAVQFPEKIIGFATPGYGGEQAANASLYLAIMFPLIIFLSAAAIVTAALHSIHHFLSPALGPIFSNITVISALLLGLYFKLPVPFLCVAVVLASIVELVPRIRTYYKNGFTLCCLNQTAWSDFRNVMSKFLPCLLGVGVNHTNLIVDSIVGSYLPEGELTLLHHAYRFLNVPLSAFAITASVTLLPYFSSVAIYAKKRLHFYLLEVAKVITWAALPTAFFIGWHSKNLFSMLFASYASPEQISMAATLLVMLVAGLPFLCLNRSLTKIFYSLGDTVTPTIVVGITTTLKIFGNIFSVFVYGGVYGIILTTLLGALLHTPIMLWLLIKNHNFTIHLKHYFLFVGRYMAQLAVGLLAFVVLDNLLNHLLGHIFAVQTRLFFITNIALSGTIILAIGLWLWKTRHQWKVKAYFLP
jgi:putative peptidoglycan lipid II flippase